MEEILFYIPEGSAATAHAATLLRRWGFAVTAQPSPRMTHVLLGVPAKGIPVLPEHVTVFGGNLPAMPQKSIDLLQDEAYLAQNAAITAHCALAIAMENLPVTLDGCKTLIIGWGRIGKCLAPLLKALGAKVTVAARKEADRAISEATGYGAVETGCIDTGKYRLIINTVPAPVLDADVAARDALWIDLASKKGIFGENVLWARGLPGKDTPESSGELIARTVLRYLGKEQL